MRSRFTLLLLLTGRFLFSQSDSTRLASHVTTPEEYNLLAKGYHIQVESGLDMKRGYRLDPLGQLSIGDFHFQLKQLVRETSGE